jgi:hypothetical protein
MRNKADHDCGNKGRRLVEISKVSNEVTAKADLPFSISDRGGVENVDHVDNSGMIAI